MRSERTLHPRAPQPRLRRRGSGYVVTAPGLFVWEESRREAESWARDLAGHGAGLRAALPERSYPEGPTDGVSARRARQSRPRAP
jgi:hypothetical protein